MRLTAAIYPRVGLTSRVYYPLPPPPRPGGLIVICDCSVQPSIPAGPKEDEAGATRLKAITASNTIWTPGLSIIPTNQETARGQTHTHTHTLTHSHTHTHTHTLTLTHTHTHTHTRTHTTSPPRQKHKLPNKHTCTAQRSYPRSTSRKAEQPALVCSWQLALDSSHSIVNFFFILQKLQPFRPRFNFCLRLRIHFRKCFCIKGYMG